VPGNLTNVLIDAGYTPGGNANYDNLSYTPEPTSLGLLAIGGLALIKRRRQ